MKIMSLNVNRFSGVKKRDFTNKFESLVQCPKANEIISYVKDFLTDNPQGVTFLHEIPYMGKYNQNTKKMNWLDKERDLYKEFKDQFPQDEYEISRPGKDAFSCTLAIWKKDSGWELCKEFNAFRWEHINPKLQEKPSDYVSKLDYSNKCVELLNDKLHLHLLGLHAPLEGTTNDPSAPMRFLRDLRDYAKKPAAEKFIILGDINIATDNWRVKDRIVAMHNAMTEWDTKSLIDCIDFLRRFAEYTEIIQAGYEDIIEKVDGIEGTGTFVWKEKRKEKRATVDHVFISPNLKKNVTAKVEYEVDVADEKKIRLSDHAVIIVDIQENLS